MTLRNRTSGPPMSLANMRQNGVRAVIATCEACKHAADVNVDALPETVFVPQAGQRLRCSQCGGKAISTRPAWHAVRDAWAGTAGRARRTLGRMKSREEQLTWAKQRALICVDTGRFANAVAGLRADLDENPLTGGIISSDQARRGYKAASDAALGRGSQALTEWIEGFR